MGKKVKVSISEDQKFLRELDEIIEKYSLANRSALYRKWARKGFKELKEDLGIPLKQEIAPAV